MENDNVRAIAVFRQTLAGITGSLSLMICGCWLGWISPFLHGIKDRQISQNYTTNQISYIVSIMDFGNFVSPIPSGYSMDLIGRKPTFILCGVIYIVSWALVIVTTHSYALTTARFLAGWSKGMGYTVVPMYIAEIAEVSIRGALSTIIPILLFLGTVFSFALGPILTYKQLNRVCASIPIIFIILLYLVPESPYFLLMKGREESAYKSFCWFRHYNKKKEKNAEIGHAVNAEFADVKAEVEKNMETRLRWMDLIKRRGIRKAMFMVNTLSLIQRFAGISNMLAYSSTTLPVEGFIMGPEPSMIVFGLLLTVSYFTCLPLVDRLGRKPLLMISCGALTVVHGTSCVYYYLHYTYKMNTATFNWVPYICLFLFAFAYSFGIGVIPSTLLGELFPIALRGKAAAVATMFFSMGSFITNKAYLPVKESIGVYLMFAFYTFVNLFCVFFTYFFIIETKNMSLKQIQDILEATPSSVRTDSILPSNRNSHQTVTPQAEAQIQALAQAQSQVKRSKFLLIALP